MKILKNIDPKLVRALKITGFVALAIVVLAVLVGLVNGRGLSIDKGWTIDNIALSPAPDHYRDGGMMTGDFTTLEVGTTSTHSISPITPGSGDSVTVDAEDFEVVDYHAEIRTRNLDRTCGVISDLKPLSYVIFEGANESTTSCSYSFKVERERVSEVLAVIEELDPRTLSENTRTIKRQLDDYASERDILEQKIAAIDETLESALSAYEEITQIASQGSDASSLARVITSRVEIIERLTNERLNLAAQMERIVRAESDALERVDYTQFNVRVYESKYFDGERLADSWRDALRNFFNNANDALMGLTLGLVSFVLVMLPFVLYALVFIFALKYLIRFVKYIWRL